MDIVKKDIWGNEDFWKNIPEDCKKAISELKRLKVYECLALDCEETFADVWWLALHEVDMFVEGYFTANDGGMTKQQAKRADNWLIKWLPLFNKYKSAELYDSDFCYSGQVD